MDYSNHFTVLREKNGDDEERVDLQDQKSVQHHESFSFESIVFIVMTVWQLCSDHWDNE